MDEKAYREWLAQKDREPAEQKVRQWQFRFLAALNLIIWLICCVKVFL